MRHFEIDIGSDETFTIDKDERLELIIDADMSGCDSGGSRLGGFIKARLKYGMKLMVMKDSALWKLKPMQSLTAWFCYKEREPS